MTEVLDLKLLRLLLAENVQSTFGARRLNEASALDDALSLLNSIWDADDNIFAANIHPLYYNKQELLYWQHLKDILQKHSFKSRKCCTICPSLLKEDVSLTANGENVERAMETPRALVHEETPVVLVTGGTRLPEEPPLCPIQNTSVMISLLRTPSLPHTLAKAPPLSTYIKIMTATGEGFPVVETKG